MVDAPCSDCTNLIGATSAESPHVALSMLIFRNQPSSEAQANHVEFYRCGKCRTLLVRDLHVADRHAQWDWVKPASGNSAHIH
jgi:hypothetical protein